MSKKICKSCLTLLPIDSFRARSNGICTWCQWASPSRIAHARYKDLVKADRRRRKESNKRLHISEEDFVAWYLSQKDQCYYCGTTREELIALRLKRGSFGYFVSWDIDRKDSSRSYEKSNIALSCFMCNMAKASYFTENEGYVLGGAVRKIIEQRLSLEAKQSV